MIERDRIYFLLKDPYWSFIWWEISPESVAEIQAQIGNQQSFFTIRIHDVTDILFNGHNSHSQVDLEVRHMTDHWYFQIPLANRNYIAEAGYTDEQHRFYPLIRSNTLLVPPDSPVQNTEETWSSIIL